MRKHFFNICILFIHREISVRQNEGILYGIIRMHERKEIFKFIGYSV